MTYNCCISTSLHLVCYQKMTVKLEGNPCECLIAWWFSAFGTDWFTFVGEFVGDAQVYQMHWSVYKSRMSMSNSSNFCQTSGPWYSCPCWKASMALKVTFLKEITFTQIFQHFDFAPQLVLEMIPSITQSLVKKFEGYSAWTQQIFFIDKHLIRGIWHTHVPYIFIFILLYLWLLGNLCVLENNSFVW